MAFGQSTIIPNVNPVENTASTNVKLIQLLLMGVTTVVYVFFLSFAFGLFPLHLIYPYGKVINCQSIQFTPKRIILNCHILFTIYKKN